MRENFRMVDEKNQLFTRTESEENYLFISYATEDFVFADWLAKKLTVLGYNVWLDRMKFKGGESYPVEFPDIIKNKTFRFLALLSTYSIAKENPGRERTVASNVKRDKKINDFVIPLKVDDFPNTDLPFFEVDLNYIPFNRDWGQGLAQLVDKLEQINTPKSSGSIQKSLRDQLISNHIPEVKQETLVSNVYKVSSIPQSMLIFKNPKKTDLFSLSFRWAHYREGDYVYSFTQPPEDANLEFVKKSKIEDIDTSTNTKNILIFLLRKEIDFFCISRGMKKSKVGQKLIFPKGKLKKDKIYYTNIKGRKTYKTMVGFSKKFTYHISPVFKLSLDDLPFDSITIVPTLYWTHESGAPLSNERAFKKSKKLRGNWWNNKWLEIVTAIAYWLGDGEKEVKIVDSTCGEFKISLEPLTALSNFGIVEEEKPKTESSTTQVNRTSINTEETGDHQHG